MANTYNPNNAGQSYRIVPPEQKPGEDVMVLTPETVGNGFDSNSGTTQIALPDGSVSISFGPPVQEQKDSKHEDNLAERLTESELSTIAERLLLGIEQDSQSRSAWLENMSSGISLLGLEVKQPKGAAANSATPAEGVSTVDHPLLLEAVLRFQANARGELLPTDGPVKVRNDGEANELTSKLAQALQKDLNHYLTKVAKEYYPDTDRMLIMLGFSGISFKKGYHDPIKRRPVIASIDAKDLIVSNAATDIDGAGRVTHRIMMRPSVLKRMQLVGAYRDIALPTQSLNPIQNPVDAKIGQIQGIAPPSYIEPNDQDRELYECYCEIDIPGFEHKLDKEVTGLPLPYKVTIDRDARRILEIRRNWEEDDSFCMPRNRIVAYIFIPGLGFYGIGLLNILGNSTKAVTAAWRLMIDAGMFANFPGFLYVKSLAKQLTNQFRVPPGGGMPIDTVGGDIRSSVMPLPYKDPSAVFIQLIDNIAQTAQRVGGTAEMQVGEGKQDAPVGTTLALIEQATKLMSAVHKRLHQAQGQEFDMLKSMLMEDPSALWRHNKKSKVLEILIAETGGSNDLESLKGAELRHHAIFLQALNDCDLTPAADPNTSSQTERYLKVVAMRQMAQTNPNIDINKVDERAFTVMGIDDSGSLFKQPAAPGTPPPPPSPEQMVSQATLIAANARMMDSETKAKEVGIKAASLDSETKHKAADLETRVKVASLGVAKEIVFNQGKKHDTHKKFQFDHHHKTKDRQHGLALASMGHQKDVLQTLHGAQQEGIARDHQARESGLDRAHQMQQSHIDRSHQFAQGLVDKQHEAGQEQVGRQTDAAQSQQSQQLDLGEAERARQHELQVSEQTRQHEIEQAEKDRKHQLVVNAQQHKHSLAQIKAKPVPKPAKPAAKKSKPK